MSENDRTGDRPAGRPKVKVTDRRRVREEGAAPATPSEAPGSGDPRSTPEAELAAARKEAAEYRDHLMRLQAEFDNYRKRVLKEQTRALELAAEPIVRRMLEVLDEFELALMAAEQKPDFDRFLHGVELVYAKLAETLGAEGLERIDAQGKPFDPERHEALMGSGGGDGEPVVADVLRQGYTLKGRVVRPAGVRVTHER
ncbi:MAG: nucleotide exchange factor GrpE [Actinobacteria bacterium]|nr:MAG: nucleotide exchange factor GrpE [Actinomycetota bacterium]